MEQLTIKTPFGYFDETVKNDRGEFITEASDIGIGVEGNAWPTELVGRYNGELVTLTRAHARVNMRENELEAVVYSHYRKPHSLILVVVND